jgi:hypothetical protein
MGWNNNSGADGDPVGGRHRWRCSPARGGPSSDRFSSEARGSARRRGRRSRRGGTAPDGATLRKWQQHEGRRASDDFLRSALHGARSMVGTARHRWGSGMGRYSRGEAGRRSGAHPFYAARMQGHDAHYPSQPTGSQSRSTLTLTSGPYAFKVSNEFKQIRNSSKHDLIKVDISELKKSQIKY